MERALLANQLQNSRFPPEKPHLATADDSGRDDNDKTVLFTTLGRGLRTPQLWDQEVDEALEVLDIEVSWTRSSKSALVTIL